MSGNEKGKKTKSIEDSMSRFVKGSGSLAVQAVDSASAVLKAGLNNAEDLTARAGDIWLNTTRRAIGAGNILAGDVREATKNMVSGTIKAASEIREELKGIARSSAAPVRPEKEAEAK